jgi:hypothetical protein
VQYTASYRLVRVSEDWQSRQASLMVPSVTRISSFLDFIVVKLKYSKQVLINCEKDV